MQIGHHLSPVSWGNAVRIRLSILSDENTFSENPKRFRVDFYDPPKEEGNDGRVFRRSTQRPRRLSTRHAYVEKSHENAIRGAYFLMMHTPI